MWLTVGRNIARMELYKIVAEVSLTEALERSSLILATALSQVRGGCR
jgi:hypothetical protein